MKFCYQCIVLVIVIILLLLLLLWVIFIYICYDIVGIKMKNLCFKTVNVCTFQCTFTPFGKSFTIEVGHDKQCIFIGK